MTIRVTARQLQACGIFRKHGCHTKGAGAIVGNLVQESGPNLDSTMYRARPDASGGVRYDLKSGGIAEWLGDRKLACIEFSRTKEALSGLARDSLLNDLEIQCEFVVHELKYGESGNNPKQYEDLWRQLTTETLDANDRQRSIATLTANFMALYERPKMGTHTDMLGEVRIPYAEAIADRYAMIEEAEEPKPQPAPPAPVPSVPAPEPYHPIPTIPPRPSPGLPPVSASTAGRQAAELDRIDTTLANLDSEIAAIHAERAAWQLARDTIEKLSPVPAIDAPVVALPKPGLNQVITPQKRTQTMFGKSWITSVFGVGTIGAAVASVVVDVISTGQMPNLSTILMAFAVVGTGGGLTQAKDKAVTGGTISAMTGNTVPVEATVPDTPQHFMRPL